MEDLGIKALAAFHAQVDAVVATYKKKLLDMVKDKETGPTSTREFLPLRDKLIYNLGVSIGAASHTLYRDYPK